MALFKIILFMGCIAFAACTGCQYSGCALTLLKSGEEVCKEHGYDFFTGETDGTECSDNTTARAECCRFRQWGRCKITIRCHPPWLTHKEVCESEFGGEYKPRYHRRCVQSTWSRYECCQHD